jgi:hypothetical protein
MSRPGGGRKARWMRPCRARLTSWAPLPIQKRMRSLKLILSVAALAVAAGCVGDDVGARPMPLTAIDHAAARSGFLVHRPVSVPAGWKLTGTDSIANGGRVDLLGMDFQGPVGGPLMVQVEQAAGRYGARHVRVNLRGAALLETVTVRGARWRVYHQPSVRGTMATHRYADGVSLVMYGDANAAELRSLMAAFSTALVVGPASAA